MKGSVHRRGSKWYYKFRSPEREPSTGTYPWITKGGFGTEKEAWKACRDAMREADRGRVVKPSSQKVRHSYATGALKAGIHPKVVSDRIGHANVGFFLQTYAHVLGNDDRDAADQAATFLLGEGWGLGESNNSKGDETV